MSRAANLWVSDVRVEGGQESSTSKFILWILAEWSRECGHSWIGLGRLAEITQRDPKTIRSRLEDLERLGLIRIDLRFGRSGKQLTNAYELMLPADRKRRDPDCMVCDPAVTSALERPERRPNEDRTALPAGAPPHDPPPETATPPHGGEGTPGNDGEGHSLIRSSIRNHSPDASARDHLNDPKWLDELHAIPAWSCDRDDWIIEKIAGDLIDASVALRTALSLVAKWDPRKWKRPAETFRNWARNEQDRTVERRAALPAPSNGRPRIEWDVFRDDVLYPMCGGDVTDCYCASHVMERARLKREGKPVPPEPATRNV